MKPYEYKRYYHPRLGKFVYKHKGYGIIVDNIFKPIKRAMSTVVKKVVKPIGKRALKSGISHAGEQVGKKISEKSGDLIMKRLQNMRNVSQKELTPILNKEMNSLPPMKNNKQKTTKPSEKKRQESTDMIINRLISGDGFRR